MANRCIQGGLSILFTLETFIKDRILKPQIYQLQDTDQTEDHHLTEAHTRHRLA